VIRDRFRRLPPLPHLRQELLQFTVRRLADVGQHAGQVLLRIKAMPLGAGDRGVQSRVVLSRRVLAGELLSTHRQT